MSRLASLTPPQGWSAALVDHLGIEPWRIPVVVIAAIAVYVSLVLLLRVFGARLLSGLSTFDTVVAIMIGSMGARVIFGHPPTLAAGLIGILTLVLLEVVFGAVVSTVRAGGVEQAACVIMEASGHLSVIRAGVPIDPALLAGVVGAERMLGPTD